MTLPDYLDKFDRDTRQFYLDSMRQLHQSAYKTGAKKLFAEALAHYLKAMRNRNLLNSDDKELILLAVDGLTQLNNFPLARVLIRVAFSYLTADEMSDIFDKARQVQRDKTLFIPF